MVERLLFAIAVIGLYIILKTYSPKMTAPYPNNSNRHGSTMLPVGTIVQFASDIIPDQWLLCDGSAVSRTTYAPLFSVINILYGEGDRIHTFNLPDFRGRFPLGLDKQLKQQSGAFQGGLSSITLTKNELPSHTHAQGSLSSVSGGEHTHTYDDPGHDHGGKTGSESYSKGSWPFAVGTGHGNDHGTHSHIINRDYTKINIRSAGEHTHAITGETAPVGNGKAFSIMPPYQIVNYIIYVGPHSLETTDQAAEQ